MAAKRKRYNFQGGSLTQALSATDTQMFSSELSLFPAIDATIYAALTIDQEIVWVTQHLAGANSAQILRSQESTQAAPHFSAAKWRHGPTAFDFDNNQGPPGQGFVWRNNWIPNTAYAINDCYDFNGSAYIVTNDYVSAGSYGIVDQSNNSLMVSKGDAGPAGPAGAAAPVGISWHGNWNGSVSYSVNDAVVYTAIDGSTSVYYSLTNSNLNNPPTANPLNWSIAFNGAKGTAGANGINGATVIAGTNNPTTQGNNGDFYINTTTWNIFGPKAVGTWPSGSSLIGPQGPQGPANTNAVTNTGGGLETLIAANISSSSYNINVANANGFELTFTQSGSSPNIAFTFTNFTANKVCSIWVILHQSSGTVNSITWPSSVKWPFGATPSILQHLGATAVLTFVSTDGGNTIYGTVGGDSY